MTYSALPQPDDTKMDQQAEIPSPDVFLVDCGCFQGRYQTFGVASGSYVVVGMFKHDGEPQTDLAGEPLPSAVKNGKIKDLFEKLPKARVVSLTSRSGASKQSLWLKVPAVAPEEVASPEQILCDTEQIFVFIPDTHIGMRDSADDFARFDASNTENLDDLLALLQAARAVGATIVQTGDLFDLWEVEAQVKGDIYYASAGVPSTYRDGKTRARRAAEEILAAWRKDDAKERFDKAMELIDLYLPGNHDVDIEWSENEFLKKRYLRMPELTGATRWDEKHREKLIFRSLHHDDRASFEAEHGHQYDPNNQTLGRTSEDDVLANVPGERITFTWARRQRGQVPRTRLVQPPKEDGIALWEEIRHPDDKPVGVKERALEVGLEVYGPNDPNGNERYLYTLGAEIGSFNWMREGLAQSLVGRAATMNSGLKLFYHYEFGPPMDEQSPYKRTALWMPAEGATAKPVRLPVRAVFHSHTHAALIRRLRFVATNSLDLDYRRKFLRQEIRECVTGADGKVTWKVKK